MADLAGRPRQNPQSDAANQIEWSWSCCVTSLDLTLASTTNLPIKEEVAGAASSFCLGKCYVKNDRILVTNRRIAGCCCHHHQAIITPSSSALLLHHLRRRLRHGLKGRGWWFRHISWHDKIAQNLTVHLRLPPQWGAADAEIKVPSGEDTELKRSLFKTWSKSVYSHTCYAYCQGFLPCLFLPFQSIHLHFFQNLSRFLLCWLWLTHGSCVGPQNKIGHPAGYRFPCWVPVEYK